MVILRVKILVTVHLKNEFYTDRNFVVEFDTWAK